MEIRLDEEVQKTAKEGQEKQKRMDKIEADVIKDRRERQEYERKRGELQEQHVTMESRKEMERKMEAAMEQIKILNLDLGKEHSDRKTLVEEAIRIIKEKVGAKEREEFERIMSGTRVSILGNGTSIKELEKGKIYTVPILLTCRCRSEKERLENLVRKAGISVSFQWPKESLDFVKGIREKVEEMGYESQTYFTRIRPTLVQGLLYIRTEVRKKDGGSFEKVGYWRSPPIDRAVWRQISREPEWTAAKKK